MNARGLKSLVEYLRKPAARSAQEFGDEIEEEIAFHVSERTREFIAQGMPEDQARMAARARFGNPSQVAAECHVAAIGLPVIWHRLHLILTAILALVALGLWLTMPPSIDNPQILASRLPPGIATMLDHDWTGDVSGLVVDEQGQPIPEARVLVVIKTWPDKSYFQRAYHADCDKAGSFQILNVYPADELYEVQIAAVAIGRAITSSYRGDCHGELEPLILKLPPSSELALQIESDQGAVLTGIEVLPYGRIEPSGASHTVYFDSAQSLIRRTGRDGRVALPYFQPGDTASVMLRTSKGEWETHDIVVPNKGTVVTIRISPNLEAQSKES